jgi:cytochrome-b5 reductase
MWQILQHALTNKENKTKFTLIFGNNEERDILLKKEFEYLEKEYPDTFKVTCLCIPYTAIGTE